MLKAIAIVMIMAHNFAHLINGTVTENEYRFDVFRTSHMWHNILQPDGMLILNLLSFFGHYGVPIFLFLSGYGLVKKYERQDAVVPSVGSFIGRHYVKLLKLMLLGLIVFLAVNFIKFHTFKTTWVNLGAQLTMIINLLSEPWMRIKPGPYWFFGLMIQLYIIYRLFIYSPTTAKHRRWIIPILFVVICQVAQIVGARYDLLYWMRYNFFVAGLPFSMGILMARYDHEIRLNRWLWLLLALISAVIVLPMNLRFQIWLWAGAAVIVAAIALVKALPAWTHRALAWLGGLSAMLFVVHPIVRALLLEYGQAGHPYLWLCIYLVVSLVLAIPYKWLLDRIKIG